MNEEAHSTLCSRLEEISRELCFRLQVKARGWRVRVALPNAGETGVRVDEYDKVVLRRIGRVLTGRRDDDLGTISVYGGYSGFRCLTPPHMYIW